MTEMEAADIFMQNAKFVRVVAYESAPAKSLVDDITHDTFIYFVQNASRWSNDTTRIQALLRKITRGMARDHWRTYIKNLPEQLAQVALYLQQEHVTDRKELEPFSNEEEKLLALRNCLAKLSDANRKLVEMVYFDDRRYSDIQQETDKSRDAVYMKMYRIRESLYRCITRTLGIEVDDE